MVFAKVVADGGAHKVLRQITRARSEQHLFTKRLLQTIAGSADKEEIAALKERHLTSSSALINIQPPTTSRQLVDVIFKTKHTSGTWASAIKYLQRNVIDTGVELTADHAARVISLWAPENSERPPLRLLLQWWTLISLERPAGLDRASKGPDGAMIPPMALKLLPTVAAAMGEGRALRAAEHAIRTEAIIANDRANPLVTKAREGAIAAALNPCTTAAIEQEAIEQFFRVSGQTLQLPTKSICDEAVGIMTRATAVSANEVGDSTGADSSTAACRAGPSFMVVFDEMTGTLTKWAREDVACSFNGIANAIVSTRPTPQAGAKFCESFVAASSPNAASVLQETRLRYLFRYDPQAACAFFDSLPQEHRTPFMAASCLHFFVSEGTHHYDIAVAYASHMCDVWGPFTVPSSTLNRLAVMRCDANHTDAFWLLAKKCRHRFTSVAAKAVCDRHLSNATPTTAQQPEGPRNQLRNMPVNEVLNSLGSLVEMGSLNGAKMVVDRLPTIPKGRGSAEDDMILDALLRGGGDDWELALDAMRKQ